MNVHAPALGDAHLPDEQTSIFAKQAVEDLSQHPKRLSTPRASKSIAPSQAHRPQRETTAVSASLDPPHYRLRTRVLVSALAVLRLPHPQSRSAGMTRPLHTPPRSPGQITVSC